LKKSNRLFQDAERLTPSPDLWKRIEARTALARGGSTETGFWGAPAMRAAAAVVLAVGLLGLGLVLQKRSGIADGAAYAVSGSAPPYASASGAQDDMQVDAQDGAQDAPQAMAGREAEMVDAELLGWHADLGDDLGDNPDETVAGLTEALDVGGLEVAAEAEELL
jgi:hypothetical protein